MYKKEYLTENDILDGLVIKDMRNFINEIKDDYDLDKILSEFDKIELPEKFSKELDYKSEKFKEKALVIRALENKKINNPIELDSDYYPDKKSLIDNRLIIAEKGSEMTLVIDAKDLEDKEVLEHRGINRILVKDNATLNIIKIQRFNDKINNYDLNLSIVKNRGKINWVTVEIGANHSQSYNLTKLEKEGSEADIRSIYFGDEKRELDLNYIIEHYGAHSKSEIESRGVLKDEAKKNFNGKLHFKKEARQADGSEKEYVLLMDKTVNSNSTPALFTEEDNVEGEHAVSAGQIDEDRLYYLMSRGFDEVEAKRLLVEAAFNPIFEKIPLNELKGSVMNEVKRRLEK
ncbi:MAG: Fe-S cluster assembly protein SufD [Bacillota bacterium]